MDRDAPGGQWKGDPPGPDPELERSTLPGNCGEEVHRGFDDGPSGHLVKRLVVVVGDCFAEEPVVIVHRTNLA